MIQFFCGVWHHTCLCFGTGQILCVVQYAPPHNMRMRGIMVHNRDGQGEEKKIKQTGNQRHKKIPVLFAREICVRVCRFCVHCDILSHISVRNTSFLINHLKS